MTTKGRTKVRCSSHCSTLLPFPLVSSGHPGNRSAAGDVTPVTVGGKVFTFFVLIVGLGIVAVPTGLFASALSKARVGESVRLWGRVVEFFELWGNLFAVLEDVYFDPIWFPRVPLVAVFLLVRRIIAGRIIGLSASGNFALTRWDVLSSRQLVANLPSHRRLSVLLSSLSGDSAYVASTI
jgi:hypothetical protein